MNDDIIISTHAKERLFQRMGVSPRKVVKVVRKAWNAAPIHPDKIKVIQNKNEYYNKEGEFFRELMGKIFIFGRAHHDRSKTILLTVI